MYYAACSSSVDGFIIALYFVSCIFIGNWMLLNLLLSIILDSFAAVEDEEIVTPERKDAIRQKMLDDLRYKDGEDFIEGMEEMQKEGFFLKADKPKGKKKKKKQAKTENDAKPKVVNILEES